MMQKPVLKIMKSGKSLDSTDLRDYIFHSDHTCFKIHTISSGQITINAGGTTGYVDISHNLGYVPVFLIYEDGVLLPSNVVAYANTSKIRITKNLSEPYDQTITTYYPDQYIYSYPGAIPTIGVVAGKLFGTSYNSALWFDSISIARGQTVNKADFEFKKVRTTSGSDIKFKIWGIDEDNTSDFSGGYPSGRPKTDAVRTKIQSPNTSEFNFGDEWTELVQEIVNRSGWSSGNHMGFMIEDNGTDDDRVLYFNRSETSPHGPDLSNLILKITLTGTGTLTSNYKVVIFKDKIA